MNKILITSTTAASILLLAACSGGNQQTDNTVIDIAGAISSPKELKVSDLGSKITYVPLETNDSALIPQTWMLIPTENRLLVVNYSTWGIGHQNCLAFDSNGKFLGAIGHTGQDPEAYSSPFPLVSPDGNRLYFTGYSGQGAFEQVYSIDGTYLGRVFPKMPPLGNPSSSVLIDTTIVTIDAPYIKGVQYFTVYSGGLNSDSVTTFAVNPIPSDLDRSMFFNDVVMYNVKGVMRNPVANYTEYIENGGEKRHLFNAHHTMPRIWRTNGQTHYRISLTDTILNITPESVEVAYTFDCGPGAITPQEMNSNGIQTSNIIVSDLCETPSLIVFGASRGWMRDDNHEPFVGYFDKATGKTFATSAKEGFVDDLTGFMPFYPVLANERGDLIGIITMDDIAAWTEAHPDAEIPEALRNLAEDANPICVIVSK
ncbi:MAG: DUF4934 domain-containing protein [Paramuribaculum sp.]|nr:DUF4934 domain-containing protein [Paramuribaculum sp.]